MLTVPEAARLAGREPETVRRWIRSGKLRASKVGTRYLTDAGDLDPLLADTSLPILSRWRHFESGRPQPAWAAALARSRRER